MWKVLQRRWHLSPLKLEWAWPGEPRRRGVPSHKMDSVGTFSRKHNLSSRVSWKKPDWLCIGRWQSRFLHPIKFPWTWVFGRWDREPTWHKSTLKFWCTLNGEGPQTVTDRAREKVGSSSEAVGGRLSARSVGRKRRSRTMSQDCNVWAIREHQQGDSGFWKFDCWRKRRWIGRLS